MRRKDWKYYLKTIFLKWNAYRFSQYKKTETYRHFVKQRREEYLNKLKEVDLQFSDFNPFYQVYFYFGESQIFNKVYEKIDGVPIRLKSQNLENPLLPFYFGLLENNAQLKKAENSPEIFTNIDIITDDLSLVKSDLIIYNYLEDYELFNLKAPWNSGLTQSLACSYYCRRAYSNQESSFITKAEKLFASLVLSVEKGGLLQSTKDGLEWVEEYPSKPASYVLNGHMFAIIAAIELFQCTNIEEYAFQAKLWIKSLLHHLPEYQYKQYLLHNKYQNKLSNIEYQGLYIGLFKHLYQLTKHPIFLEFYTFYQDNMDWKSFYRFYGISPKN